MRRFVIALALGAALVGAVAAPAGATQGRSVPFDMRLVGVDRPLQLSPGFPFVGDTFGGRCSAASSWVTTIDSAGTARHIGTVSVVQSHCTVYDVMAPDSTHRPFADGRMVITGADGDQLWVNYAGWFLFTPTSEAVGISDIQYATMTVVGGTGRFEGASGTLTGRALDNFPAGPNTAHVWGSIVYDPSVQAAG